MTNGVKQSRYVDDMRNDCEWYKYVTMVLTVRLVQIYLCEYTA